MSATQHQRDNAEFFTLLLRPGITVSDLISAYLSYHGLLNSGHKARFVEAVRAALTASGDADAGKLRPQDVLGVDGDLSAAFLASHALRIGEPYYSAVYTDTTTQNVFPGSVNEWHSDRLPFPYRMGIGRRQRGSFDIISVSRGSLFASAHGYMLFDQSEGIYWPLLSSRTYSRSIEHYPQLDVQSPVVNLQDQFNSTNFCHFLYDVVPRLIYFAEVFPDQLEKAVFLLGGARGAYQTLLVDILMRRFSLRSEQMLWLEERVILHSDRWFFFSDHKLGFMHPMHQCLPKTLAFVSGLAEHLALSSDGPKKIYISRKDTHMRRLRNEDELVARLSSTGHVSVSLSSMGIQDQIAVVAGAKSIVAPHGMGLTNIVFNKSLGHLLEVFNPEIGSDSYAFTAKALGVPYSFIIGSDSRSADNLSYQADIEAIAAHVG